MSAEVRHIANPDLAGEDAALWPGVLYVLKSCEPHWQARGGHDHTRRLLGRCLYRDPGIRMDVTADGTLLTGLLLTVVIQEGRSKYATWEVAWSEPGNPSELVKFAEATAKQWAAEQGCTHLIVTSYRNSEAMARRTGGETVYSTHVVSLKEVTQ